MQFFDWCFRNRVTGAITIGQWPNAALWIVLAVATVEWVLAPTGHLGTAMRVVGTAALAYWAAGELLRGVNPWRRALGAGALCYLAFRLLV